MSTDPSTTPDPEVLPSSTPDGPQTIPAPTTPEGEPGPDAPERFENAASNPNSTGPAGLSGGMGVSSERTGPAGEDPRGLDTGIAGTGSKGGAVSRTDGGFDTSPTEWDAVDVSQPDLHPNRAAELDDTSGQMADTVGPDRTVGEPRPNPIPDDPIRLKHGATGGDS